LDFHHEFDEARGCPAGLKLEQQLFFVSGAQSAIGLSLPFGFGNYAAFC
jgi:hypothetical protein